MATARKRAEVETEITEHLGIVPGFMKSIPEPYLDFEWELFKKLELGETLIPNKYKELMGVAIHSETKCRYCILFHSETAKLFGATDAEIQEATHYAKMSLGWSAYLKGMQTNYDAFASELKQLANYVRTKMS